MIDQSGILIRDDLRRVLVARMAEYEAAHGPVQTLPIICGTDKRIPFSISNPEKPKDEKARTLRDLADKRGAANTVKKRQSAKKIDKLREMAPKGAKIIDMCDATGLTPNTVMRYLKEHAIQRGPQTDLEAV